MKLKLMAGAIIVLCFGVGIRVSATEQKTAGKGKMDGFIQVFSEDILYLEKEVNDLMAECGKELNE